MNRIRELRKNRKLTMKELGHLVGLSESTISLYETEKHDPDLLTLCRIADVFEVSLDELVGHEIPLSDKKEASLTSDAQPFDTMTIADNIRTYRKKSGLSQAEIGERCGVSAQAVSKWELGKAQPDTESIATMCVLFGVSANDLMGIENANKIVTAESVIADDRVKLNNTEKSLIADFRSLNAEGQEHILKTMAMALLAYRQNDAVSVMEVG